MGQPSTTPTNTTIETIPSLSSKPNPNCGVCTDFRTLNKKVAKKSTAKSTTTTQITPLPCSPDSSELGRSTWTFLHTMAAYYPEQPTTEDQTVMRQFLHGLGRFYPCSYCASHLQQELIEMPPKVESNEALSQWFCMIHNRVNERLGKPQFDCSRVLERWRNSRPDCIDPFSQT